MHTWSGRNVEEVSRSIPAKGNVMSSFKGGNSFSRYEREVSG